MREVVLRLAIAAAIVMCYAVSALGCPDIWVYPFRIGYPTYTKPGVQLDTTIRVTNKRDTNITINEIRVGELNGPPGWLGTNTYGPVVVSCQQPGNYYDIIVHLNNNGLIVTGPQSLDGYVEIEFNETGDNTGRLSVHLTVADTVQFPETGIIRTECKGLAFNNSGNLAAPATGALYGNSLNFFNDCDTTDNLAGQDDNAKIYLYEASPFVLRIRNVGDTVLNYNMYNADFMTDDGFKPLEGLVCDSTTHPDYRYGRTGRFTTSDSSIGLEVEYFASTHPDSCDFIITRQRIYIRTQIFLAGIYLGDIYDWDIPSDSRVENGSGYDTALNLMYCYGAEYGSDYKPNDDCILAAQRLGGLAYYSGYKLSRSYGDKFYPKPNGPWWTDLNANWIWNTGGFVASQLYQKSAGSTGYTTWQSTHPEMEDSLYQDLHMVAVSGQFNLFAGDTLLFYKIIATESDGGLPALKESIIKARQWIQDRRSSIFPMGRCCYGDPRNPSCSDLTLEECLALDGRWNADKSCATESCPIYCCRLAGDCCDDGTVNILDVACMINWLYKGSQDPYCHDQCDPDGNNAVNILDAGRLIGYLYKNGAAPICGTTGH